tara:strand:- start:352 stop:1734 length:1383 start_codon:yes stop_codon:yes gene_type:complete
MIFLQKNTLKILQFLIYLFPISFIFGNLITNLFISFIILFGVFYYKKRLFEWFDKKFFLIILLFFFTVLVSSYYNYFFVLETKDALKSILYLRYFLFLLILRTLVVNLEINLNTFLKSCLIISFIVSLDIIFQFSFGKNILGYEVFKLSSEVKYYTGIFGDRLVAGGFILMFSTIGIFALFNIIKIEKNKYLYLIIFAILIIFFFTSLLLAGNRMPLVMFLFFLICLGIIYKKKEKFYFLFLSATMILSLGVLIVKSETIIKRAGNFYVGIPNPVIIFEEINKEYPNLKKYEGTGIQFHNLEEFKTTSNYRPLPHYTGHLPLYITSINLFMDRPLFGGGIKSFRNFCSTKIHLPNRVCENHPHNYILEILNDTGIIGFFLILFFLLYIVYYSYLDYINRNKHSSHISDWVYLAMILSLFLMFFPFKSSGSFFSTFNSGFNFLILGFSAGLVELKNKTSPK